MILEDAPGVKERLREVYTRSREYNAFSFNEFLGIVASAKNMVTRYTKGTLSSGEGPLVNSIVVLANTLGPDTCKAFEIPVITEPHYSIIRAVLHHMGLPYEQGPLDQDMSDFLASLDYKVRFYHDRTAR